MGKIPITKYGRDLEPEETFVGILADIETEFDETLKALISHPELISFLETRLLQEAQIFRRHVDKILQKFIDEKKSKEQSHKEGD